MYGYHMVQLAVVDVLLPGRDNAQPVPHDCLHCVSTLGPGLVVLYDGVWLCSCVGWLSHNIRVDLLPLLNGKLGDVSFRVGSWFDGFGLLEPVECNFNRDERAGLSRLILAVRFDVVQPVSGIYKSD